MVKQHLSGDASAAMQLALNVIPYVGPIVAQALSLYETQRRNQMLDALIGEIRDQLAALDIKKIDHAFIETAEFQDAAFRAFDGGRATSNSAKRRLIASALVGAATVDRPKGLDVEAILDTLRVLTPIDLNLARKLWEEAGGDEPMATVTAVVGPADFPDREFHLGRLEANGLIVSTAGRHLDWSGQYLLTGTFHRLMALLAASTSVS
jgi:hypothetical protein